MAKAPSHRLMVPDVGVYFVQHDPVVVHRIDEVVFHQHCGYGIDLAAVGIFGAEKYVDTVVEGVVPDELDEILAQVVLEGLKGIFPADELDTFGVGSYFDGADELVEVLLFHAVLQGDPDGEVFLDVAGEVVRGEHQHPDEAQDEKHQRGADHYRYVGRFDPAAFVFFSFVFSHADEMDSAAKLLKRAQCVIVAPCFFVFGREDGGYFLPPNKPLMASTALSFRLSVCSFTFSSAFSLAASAAFLAAFSVSDFR